MECFYPNLKPGSYGPADITGVLSMKKNLKVSFIYLLAGLAAGVFFREFTKFNHFDGMTALGTVHTHLLVLGMAVFLLLALFEQSLTLSASKKWKPFLAVYNIGLVIAAIMMLIKGVLQVQGQTSTAMIAGIAGAGHILIAIGFILLFLILFERVSVKEKS